jgi:hypothetical protein
MRRIVLCLFAVAALAGGTGCRGDKDPGLTAEAFSAQANAICKASETKLAEAGKDLLKNPNTPAKEITRFYLKDSIPSTRSRIKEIGKLKPPAEGKDTFKKMLSVGKQATDTVEDELKRQGTATGPSKSELFKEFDQLARDLGLADCTTST